MYCLEKPPRTVDFEEEASEREMMMEVVSASATSNGLLPPHQRAHHSQMVILGDNNNNNNSSGGSGGGDQEVKAPKKRAEKWVQDETRSLIALRREMDGLFNTSKSNKHLWEQISVKMRERGFDRSPTMCTDKWRNLLKEFKKANHQDRGSGGGSSSGSAKMSYYKEIDDILRERNKINNAQAQQYKSPTPPPPPPPPKIDSFMQFSDKGEHKCLYFRFRTPHLGVGCGITVRLRL